MKKPNADSKKMIERFIRQMAITVRIGVADNEFTEEEAFDFIASEGKRKFDKIMGMTDEEFAVTVLVELSQMLMKGGRDE